MMKYIATINEFLIVAAILQSVLFLAVFLSLRTKDKKPFLLLSSVLTVFLLIKLHQLGLIYQIYEAHPAYIFLLLPFQWALAPLFYVYVKSRILSSSINIHGQLFHFIPFIIASIYCLSSLFEFQESGLSYEDGIRKGFLTTSIIQLWWPSLQGLQYFVYLIYVIQSLKKNILNQQDWRSNDLHLDSKVLLTLSTFWLILVILDLTNTLLIVNSSDKSLFVNFASIINLTDYVLINVLVITGFSYFVFVENGLNQNRKKINVVSQLSKEDKISIFKLIKDYLEETKAYLSPTLTLKDISTFTKVNTRDISVAINSIYENSFYYFINEFRINEAKQLLLSNPQSTVIDIAFGVGFNSKSSFNKMFKHFTGKTPSQFKKSAVVE